MFFRKKLSSTQIAILVFCITLAVTQVIAYNIFIIEKENEQLQIQQEALRLKNQLESSLNHSFAATKMLAYLEEKNLLGNNFDSISQELLKQNKFIDALQILENTKIVKTYPLEGNESTIGYQVMEDSVHRKEALKALDRNDLYFEGPFKLKQDGIGFVGRYPIIKNEAFWGFSAVIIRLETFLHALGIDSTGKNSIYSYQILKLQDGKETNEILFKNLTDYNEGLFYKVFIPLGDWNIYVKLQKPTYLRRAIYFSVLCLLFSIILALLIKQLSSQPEKLKILVEEKTKNLEELNKILENYANELSLSNTELEQFAYIASHDMQEPLRMISGFLNQLEKKYGEQLDEKARQYIHFSVDGAKRMRQIILDLLEYSRIGKDNIIKEEINLNQVIVVYCKLRQQLIKEKRAIITNDELPVLHTYRSPLTQIFHNLLDNALKYSKDEGFTEINIKAIDKGQFWLFSIEDNGIGIDKEYFEKIFVMFQRLQEKNDNSGSGMGLAIVKKTIENLGGKVWVSSESNLGSIFYFTVPK